MCTTCTTGPGGNVDAGAELSFQGTLNSGRSSTRASGVHDPHHEDRSQFGAVWRGWRRAAPPRGTIWRQQLPRQPGQIEGEEEVEEEEEAEQEEGNSSGDDEDEEEEAEEGYESEAEEGQLLVEAAAASPAAGGHPGTSPDLAMLQSPAGAAAGDADAEIHRWRGRQRWGCRRRRF